MTCPTCHLLADLLACSVDAPMAAAHLRARLEDPVRARALLLLTNARIAAGDDDRRKP